ncbi:MAG TPA: DUF6067 family protein [bacterium]|nr:DUF6067 family protein [bacterium]
MPGKIFCSFLFFTTFLFSADDTYLRQTVIFHLDFEEGLTAASSGRGSPVTVRVNNQAVSQEVVKEKYLTDGLLGKGLTNRDFSTSLSVSYQVEKNLLAGSGTVLWWLKYEKLHPSSAGGLLFQTHGGQLFCTIGRQGRVCGYGNVPVYQSDLSGVNLPRVEDEWFQTGFSYNQHTLHFIVNGKRVATSTLRKPFQQPHLGAFFELALFGWTGETDVAVLDDFTIYRRALTEPELLFEYQRLAPSSNKTSVSLSPLGLEVYFLPGLSRLRVELNRQGYGEPDREYLYRLRVFSPEKKLINETEGKRWQAESATVLIDLPADLPPGVYTVEGELLDFSGKVLAGPVRDTFEKKKFPFEGNQLGLSDRVLPPWTPVEVDQGKREVRVWGRRYSFDLAGWLSQVETQGQLLLTSPVSLLVQEENQESPLENQSFVWTSLQPHQVSFQGKARTKNMRVEVAGRVEYDGMVKYQLSLYPAGTAAVDSLSLVIPFDRGKLSLMHATSDGLRSNYAGAIPEGEGSIWASTSLKNWSLAGSFLPYLWLGNEEAGLCWWADKDEGWQRPLNSSEPSIQLLQQGQQLMMVLKLFASPVKLDRKREIVFAFTATPVRPKPSWARNASLFQGRKRGGKGPFFFWFGSTHWALSGTDRYRQMPYTFTHITPVDEVCADWLKKKMEQVHQEGLLGLAYTDYRARSFTEETKYYAWEWAKYGTLFTKEFVADRKIYHGMEVNSVKSRLDYDLWCLNKNMEAGMDAWYFDEIQTTADQNPYAGAGWFNQEGLVEGEGHLFALRDFLKRLYTMMVDRGYQEPVIVMHMTDTMYAGPLSFATVTCDYEYAQNDPGKRLLLLRRGLEGFRTTAMGHQYGLVGTVINTEAASPYIRFGDYQPVRNWEGMQLLHDLNFQMNPYTWTDRGIVKVLSDFGYFEDDCRFIGYWKAHGRLYDVEPEHIKVSVYRRGNKALLVFLNTRNQDTLALWRPKAETGMTGNLSDADPMRGYIFWHTDQNERGFRKIFVPAYDYRLVLVDCQGNW